MSTIHTGIRDRHMPDVHLRPEANWINDPNGLVHHDGWYHVFFQHNPYAPTHEQVHWAHYRSRDLLRWEPLPLALAPTPGGDDADGCFSGSAVSHDGRLTAFLSAHRADRWWQPVAAADSDPEGIVFTKRPGLVVPEAPEGVTTYRDPFVWRDGDRWRMLVGAGMRDGSGAALLYDSQDLERWTARGPLHRRADAGPGLRTGEAWECPHLATYEDGRALLITSTWYQRTGPAHVAAWTGTPEGDGYRFSDPYRLDHGPDFYAPALMRAPDGRWLMWGWSWEARDEASVKEAGWAGLLTLPRELTLTADGRARQAPARELEGLRYGDPQRVVRRVAHGETSAVAELDGVADLRVRLGFGQDAAWGLRIATNADGTEFLDFVLRDGELTVDRGHASQDTRAHVGAYRLPVPDAAPGRSTELRILLDRSVVEVFTDAGETLTLRFYPTGGGPWTLLSRGLASGDVTLDLEAHTLRAPEGDAR
ncbi:glycoside hydrolase family 32 protein [Streptomyces sp. NPDC048639]|uniref:glycoside hydrolase family 32 protein n=1 Tax=Streptomyces sp. NPDC048639 TaxID=3365581 RepID=UPI00371EA564